MGQITVTVDLGDLYHDGEGDVNFNEVVRDAIATSVKNKVYEDFKKEAMPTFEAQVIRKITLDKELKVKGLIDEMFKKPELKKNYYDSHKVSVEEYLENFMIGYTINSNDFMNKVDTIIKSEATKIVTQLKERYDLLFASQIVQKLNANGMLKEDVARVLLGNDK